MDWGYHYFAYLLRSQLFHCLRVNYFNYIFIHKVHAGFPVTFISNGAPWLSNRIGLCGAYLVVFLKGFPQRGG